LSPQNKPLRYPEYGHEYDPRYNPANAPDDVPKLVKAQRGTNEGYKEQRRYANWISQGTCQYPPSSLGELFPQNQPLHYSNYKARHRYTANKTFDGDNKD